MGNDAETNYPTRSRKPSLIKLRRLPGTQIRPDNTYAPDERVFALRRLFPCVFERLLRAAAELETFYRFDFSDPSNEQAFKEHLIGID